MKLVREISLFSATILVIANMIGTGIFTTSGFIMREVGNPLTMLLCWFVGGIFALAGALCYGELGGRFPEAGGEYVFLRESFGKLVGFLCGWISLIVGFSAPIAAAAISFSTYLFQTVSLPSGLEYSISIPGSSIVKLSPCTLVAVMVILILSTVHHRGVLIGARVQNVLTCLKGVVILLFIVLGATLGRGSLSHFSAGLDFGSLLREEVAVSLIFVSFAYSGWNAAAYLGAEIKDPGRNIPISLFAGTGIVMALYVGLNGTYVFSLSQQEMSGVLEVGAKSAVALFGDKVGGLFSGAIGLGLLSVLSAMIMTGPRVYYAMARDGVFFEFLGKVNERHRTPSHSIALQAGIAILMVVSASFEGLLLYVGFTLSLFAMLTVIGLMCIRRRSSSSTVPYRTPVYPFTPIFFILGNLWILYYSIQRRPAAAACGLATIGTGLLLYYGLGRRRKRNSEP